MNINIEHPLIQYAQKGQPFNYEKLFLITFSPYIEEFKNTKYDNLVDKDKSIALARIIKRLEVNGVPVTEFFKEELESWSIYDNFKKILNLVEIISKDIFICFDPNFYDEKNNFAKSDRIYCVNNNGAKDYIAYQDSDKRSIFGKGKKEKSPLHLYFADLLLKAANGQLPKTK